MASKISEGPRKKRRSAPPGARFTTHKNRAGWFQERAAFPARDVSPPVSRDGAAGAQNWTELGPFNIGGRLSALALTPGQKPTLYAGAAAGGVWRSTDQGKTWKNVWDGQPTLNIGSLAIDPADSARIYCATGEANLSSDNYPGLGVFRSDDGGDSWTHIADAVSQELPLRIGALAVDPRDANHILLGGVTHKDDSPAALFASLDGGQSWMRQSFVSGYNHFVHRIEFHPTAPGLVFATIDARGSRSGIWRSRDGGATWRQLEKGLPPGDLFGRASLSLSPSDPNVLYAMAANRVEGVLGVFRSQDGGDTWNQIQGTHFEREGQMSYGNCIAVHPDDPDFAICGGVDLHRTRDGGRTWQQVTFWDAERESPFYAHADHHVLLMPAGDLILDANDGGLDVSTDGGDTWTNRSAGLAITMFYDIDVSAQNVDFVIGGTQDNGTLMRESRRADFEQVLGGDGGWAIVDPADETHLIGSAQQITVYRHRKDEGWAEITPPDVSGAERAKVWMSFIAMESIDRSQRRPRGGTIPVILLGSDRVWGSTDDGDFWVDLSGVLDGSAISALEIASTDSRVYFAGTTNGGIFRSMDRGVTWSGDLAGPELPGRIVTRIETHPVYPDIVVATCGGQLPARRKYPIESQARQKGPFTEGEADSRSSHVFLSTDGGLNWTDIDEGRLPAVPHHAAVFESVPPHRLFVCGDGGVYCNAALKGGRPVPGAWHDVSGNLPNVMVVDLVYHHGSGTLTAATYGRGLWRWKPDPIR